MPAIFARCTGGQGDIEPCGWEHAGEDAAAAALQHEADTDHYHTTRVDYRCACGIEGIAEERCFWCRTGTRNQRHVCVVCRRHFVSGPHGRCEWCRKAPLTEKARKALIEKGIKRVEPVEEILHDKEFVFEQERKRLAKRKRKKTVITPPRQKRR